MTIIDQVKHKIQDYNCNAILIANPINRLYVTGFNSSAGALVITKDDALFLTDSRYFEAAESTIIGATVKYAEDSEAYYKEIKELLDRNNITSLGFEDDKISYIGFNNWKEKLEIEMVPAGKLIADLRAVKTSEQLDKMIKSQRMAEKTFQDILPLISTDITEKQLAAELIYAMLKNGADDKAFNPIVVSGTKTSMPHGVPGDEKISNGFLTIDFGVRLNGWVSDMTRTLCVGKPDEEMINIYNTVLKAQLAGISAIRADLKGVDVDAAGRAVIEDAGYGDYFGHGFGHSLGLEVHESLKASPTSEDVLPYGTVLSAEPGIYLPGRFGVRIEDVVYITESGCQNITNTTKELIII